MWVTRNGGIIATGLTEQDIQDEIQFSGETVPPVVRRVQWGNITAIVDPVARDNGVCAPTLGNALRYCINNSMRIYKKRMEEFTSQATMMELEEEYRHMEWEIPHGEDILKSLNKSVSKMITPGAFFMSAYICARLWVAHGVPTFSQVMEIYNKKVSRISARVPEPHKLLFPASAFSQAD